jgi:ABC-type transport system involved in multi-copper enzyme maturation permease subunit
MSKIAAIARLTFQQALRERVLYVLVLSGTLFICGSVAVSLLTVGDEVKIIKDLGLASVAFTSSFVSLFIGAASLAREIERRTFLILFTKPVARWQIVAGKFLGVLGLAWLNLAVLSLLLELVIGVRTGAPDGSLASALLLTAVEQVLLSAFAVLFSSFSSHLVSSILGLGVYLIGHFTDGLELLYAKLTGLGRASIYVLILLLPNLERFNVRAEVVHRAPLDPAALLMACGYGLSYAAAVVLLAMLLLRRRSIP